LRILIVSDSHGEAHLLHRIVEREQADHVIHCGDFCTDREQLPQVSLTVVRGNCDWEPVSEEEVWEGDNWRFFVVHGHRHQVKTSLLPVRYRAEEQGAIIACFGHSHYPLCERSGNVLLINPGSIVQPRGFPFPTYAVLKVESKNQARVSYFTSDGRALVEPGGIFQAT
jgi:putative phosphoesterase